MDAKLYISEHNSKWTKYLCCFKNMPVSKVFLLQDKPVFIPEKREGKLPKVFNPPEFVRNIWGMYSVLISVC